MRRTLVLDKSGYQQLFKKSLDQSRFWLGLDVRRHQDHLRRRVSNDEAEKTVLDDFPEILIDSGTSTPNTPENEQTEDPIDSRVTSTADSNTSETTDDRVITGVSAPPPASVASSGVPKSYPKRQRKPPDWYCDQVCGHIEEDRVALAQ